MKLKNIFILISIILFSSFLIGCRSIEIEIAEKKYEREINANIEQIAKDYIKEKYGFEPIFNFYVLESEYILFDSSYTGIVCCEMEYDNEKFCVVYDNNSKYIADDYQEEEIKTDILNYIKDNCGMSETSSLLLFYGENNHRFSKITSSMILIDGTVGGDKTVPCDNCINYYYDGNVNKLFNKLSDIIIKGEIISTVSLNEFDYIDTDLDNVVDINIHLKNLRSVNEYSGSLYFNTKETLTILKYSDHREREFVKTDIKEISDQISILYNLKYKFEECFKMEDAEKIGLSIDGYEFVSPVFTDISGNTIAGNMVAQIQIKNNENLFVYTSDIENPEQYVITPCYDYETVYSGDIIAFVKKVEM